MKLKILLKKKVRTSDQKLKRKKLKKRKVSLDETMPEEQALLEQTLQAGDESSYSSKESNYWCPMGCSDKHNLNMYVQHYYITLAQLFRPMKKASKDKLSTITVGHVFQTTKKHVRARILFDSGCGTTIANKPLLRRKNIKKNNSIKWKTKAGMFATL